MKKFTCVLSVLLLFAVLPVASFAGGKKDAGTLMPDDFTYVIQPVDMGGGVFFTDLVQLKARWGNTANVRGQLNYLQEHFDEVLAKAIAEWRIALQRRWYTDIISITPISSERGEERSVTTGLIFMVKQDTTRVAKG